MKIDYSNQIRKELLQEMKTGVFSKSEKLPRELELAKHFGISRNHLREVLAQLEREGFITRIHGVGTIINHHVLQVKNRMDIEVEFLDIIRQSGYQSNVSSIHMQEEKANKYIAEKLQIAEDTDVIRVCRVCTANDRPAIYCEDVFEKRLIKETYTLKDLEPPIFHFLKKYCDVETYMDLTQLHAVLASEIVACALQIPEGTPLLNMEEIDYDISGNIVFYSNQYFVENIFEQTVLRKKL
ncbi:MAG: GntR family transcriptional regulator [Ruminococcus sp.]|nr:GntR family transcriptional regulator [Ruminococcus sp.]